MSMIQALAVPHAALAAGPPALRLVTPDAPAPVHVADILLVDPVGSFPADLAAALTRDGLVVTAATTSVLEVALTPTDLILVHAPEGQPWADDDSCRQLRDLTATPIVHLAEGPSTDHVVALLDAGADEFVTTLLRPHELVARLRAVLRGTRRAVAPLPVPPTVPRSEVGADGLLVDTTRLEVSLDGQPVHFSAREAQLLAALLRVPGHVVARHLLLDEVWGSRSSVSSKTLEKYVTAVRKRLAGHGVPPDRIAAVRGYGYRYLPAADA